MNLEPIGGAVFCPDDPGEPGLGAKRWSVSKVDERSLSELFRGLTVLEIGTGLGMSTRAIASTAKHVHTVDVDKWVKETVVPDLPENVTFYDGIGKVPPVDAAFIDGLHTQKQCLIDIESARKLVKKGGLLVFHDTKMKAIRNAIIDSNLAVFEITTEAGLGFGWNDKETP